MNRRRLLQLSGIAVGGSGVVVGSGAFTSSTAERSVSVAVADDEDAYLGINATSQLGRSFETGDPEEVSLEIPGVQEDTPDNTRGTGLGPSSRYSFTNLIEITNRGEDTVIVWSQLRSLPSGINEVALTNSNDRGKEIDNKSDGVTLTPGETFAAGLIVDTTGKTGSFNATILIKGENP